MNAEILIPELAKIAPLFPGQRVAIQISVESKEDGTYNDDNKKYEAMIRVGYLNTFHGFGPDIESALADVQTKYNPATVARVEAARKLRQQADLVEAGTEPIPA